jgi:hypothetical protein
MRRILGLALWAILFLSGGPSFAQTEFPTYVGGLTAATTPLTGSEQLYALQNGLSRRVSASALIGQMPSGTSCSTLSTYELFANTTLQPTGTQISIYDGTSCVPMFQLNQSSHIATWNGALQGPIVNVVEFGADPTGTNDSTTAIQNAINSLGAFGGQVWFPIGNYKVSFGLSVGNGTSSAISTKNGIVLVGQSIGGVVTTFNGVPTTSGPRLFWAGTTNNSMIQILGPLWGWGIQGLTFDCTNTAGVTGIEPISAQLGYNLNVTVQNCISEIEETAYATFGSVTDTNTMHNTWINTTINMGSLNNQFGILLTSSGAATANTSYETFINTTISWATGGTSNTLFPIYLQATDSDVFINTHIFGGTAANASCINFDYTSTGGSGFPAAVKFYGVDVGSCGGGHLAQQNGNPGAAATPNQLNISEANGFSCLNIVLQNFVCNSVHEIQFAPGGTAATTAVIPVYQPTGTPSNLQIGNNVFVNTTAAQIQAGFSGGPANPAFVVGGSSSGVSSFGASSTGQMFLVSQTGQGTILSDGTNGNMLSLLSPGGTIADWFIIEPSMAGGNPFFSVTGTDTNISLSFEAKGTGVMGFTGNAGTAQWTNSGGMTSVSSTTTAPSILLQNNTNDGNSTNLILQKSRSSSTTDAGDVLGAVSMDGNAAGTFTAASEIQSVQVGAIVGSHVAAQLEFLTSSTTAVLGNNLVLTQNGHFGLAAVSGGTPTNNACTGFSLGTGSSDMAGHVSITNTDTSCAMNFGATWTNAPFCTANSSNNTDAIEVSASTTVLTMTFAAGVSGLNWVCLGN